MAHRHVARVRAAGVAVALALCALPGVARAQFTTVPAPAAYALKNVTVVQADGTRATGQTLIVRTGRIAAIGRDIAIPADARVLDGDSLFVYPGLIDAMGALKFELPRDSVDPARVRSWDPPRTLQGFTPSRRVADHLKPTPAELVDLRKKGVIALGVQPLATDPLMSGRGVFVLLRRDITSPQQLVLDPVLGPSMSFRGGRGVYPVTLMGVIAWYRQTFSDAQRQVQITQVASRDARATPSLSFDPDYMVVQELLRTQGSVFFQANSADDIRRVLQLADEFKFKPIIVGGVEAWKVADDLKAKSVPVLVSVDFTKPVRWKPEDKPKEGEAPKELEPAAWREKKALEEAYANAGKLAQAGVRFALTSNGGRVDVREGARKAIEYGLTEDAALRALTLTPATLFNAPHLARVETALPATFVVTDAPMFAKDARVIYTFVEGSLEKGADLKVKKDTAKAGADSAAAATSVVNVAGKWAGEVSGPTTQSFTMTIEQKGKELSGTMESDQGSIPISGSIEGDKLTLNATIQAGGQSIALTFSGVVKGDEVTGSIETPMGAMNWKAKRSPAGARP